MKSEVIEALLNGQSICAVSNEDAHAWLAEESNRESMNSVLMHVNRSVARVGDTYHAAYVTLGDDERKIAKAHIKDAAHALGPIVRWIVMAQDAKSDDTPLRAGDGIKGAALMDAAERIPAVREELARISRMPFFGCTSDAIDAQIKQTLAKLTKGGYLVQPSPERQHYIITGKVEYLYALLHLIDEVGGLSLESLADPGPQQEALL